jgi:tight adherence protein C
MILLLLVALALLGLSAVLLLRSASVGYLRRQATLAQIDAYGSAPAAARREGVHLRRALERLVVAGGALLERRLGRERMRELRTLLDSAGLYRTTVARFLGYRFAAGIAAPALLLVLMLAGGNPSARGILLVLAVAGLGWMLPPVLLKRRARLRVERIDYEVPELVDLLVTTVEAGLGFLPALELSVKRVKGPLGAELRLMLHDQRMGLSVEEALQNLFARTDSQVLRAFAQAVIQGERLGVSLGKILRDLAVEMRKRRRQAAEERAQKAPTKILFPLTFLILPALLVVVLGPVVITFSRGLIG